MLKWNSRPRPLSFSHQEVASERTKSRQLRHSYSQREVSRPGRPPSIDSFSSSSKDIKQLSASVESINNWPDKTAVTKSTPHLAQGRSQRLLASSTGSLLQSELDDAGGSSMVTRRFKKGSVYDALASTSGLDFSPVVQLKTFNRREDSSPAKGIKPSEKLWENAAKLPRNNSKDNDPVFYKDKSSQDLSNTSSGPLNTSSTSPETSVAFPTNPKPEDAKNGAKCIAAHEKYPSWPVTAPTTSSVSYRSHSWTGHTDYPKEKVVYSRPKKANQFKISTNQLQPVLERAPDCNTNNTSESFSSDKNKSSETYNVQYAICSSAAECTAKQFDFEAFHTPCMPQYFYDNKSYRAVPRSPHSPPERGESAVSSVSESVSNNQDDSQSADSNGFRSHYEGMLQHQADYPVPLSTSSKQRSMESKGVPPGPDTPFLDKLRLDNAWQIPPPPVPMIPEGIAPQPQQLQNHGNDFELSSDNGTWMGSMESSSHARSIPKWQGSYSDLSTLSTQLSNRSSLFDSGHSTMPESGRLSPQSSCDSTAPSLLLEAPTRVQVVARHGCHRENVAHSARVQQPERHGSESILYYGSSNRINGEPKIGPQKVESGAGASGSNLPAEEQVFRSHASVTLSPSLSKSKSHEVPDCQNKTNKCPSRQDSRKSSNSFSSEDSYPRSRSHGGDDTSGSSSDVSNVTCISNYKSNTKSKNLKELSPVRNAKTPDNKQTFKQYQSSESPESKSMDETTRKYALSDSEKRQRASDPDLKAIQKQAVMSFYQRMSMAESAKSEKSAGQTVPENEAPPPYEATPMSSRFSLYPPKLSLMPKKVNKQWENQSPKQLSPPPYLPPPKPSESTLLNHHSKSVPNLVILKGQNVDTPPNNPVFKRYNGFHGIAANSSNINQQANVKRGSPLAKDETISWDELPNVLEKRREALEKAALASECKDRPQDNGSCPSGMYFKTHKSPRKVHLKEVHHSNETASVKVMTPDGVTLVQTHEQRRDDKLGAAPIPPHKRRPAPPPPPKQPPKRPPPPPPPVTPPPQVVVVVNENDTEDVEKIGELRIDVKPSSPTVQLQNSPSSPQLGPPLPSSPAPYSGGDCPASPKLPLPPPPPPPPQGNEIVQPSDEPLPPPPPPADMNVQSRTLDSSSLIYPKNSYMSYRSERKLGRHGFDGKYRRSFTTSASSVDLTSLGSNIQDGCSPNSWEQMHNIRQRGTTVIFHSDSMQSENRLQRSTSQDCVLSEEPSQPESENISHSNSQESDCNQSSISISSQSSDSQGVPSQSVPLAPASQESNVSEAPNSSADSQSNITKGTSSPSPDNVVENCDTTNDSSTLDNRTMADDSFVESDTSISNVDHNQNSVKNSDDTNSGMVNGCEMNGVDNEIENVEKSKMPRSYFKTKEEIECEQLSMDFLSRCGDTTLKNLLIPSPSRKTMADYMDGLLNLELGINGESFPRRQYINSLPKNENRPKEEECSTNESNNSEVNSKTKNQNEEVNDNQSTEDQADISKRKEDLVQSIERKINFLRNEQSVIREEMIQNELLGQKIAASLKKFAKPNELEKYSLHVEEMEKIINLLLCLSGRLAKAENVLKNKTKDADEKKIFEAKREKLRVQHEDARRLKESIDRRSNQVSTFLRRYLTDDEYENYDHFIKMKTKLILDIREIDEKISLGEEQLAALNVVAQLWKSAKS